MPAAAKKITFDDEGGVKEVKAPAQGAGAAAHATANGAGTRGPQGQGRDFGRGAKHGQQQFGQAGTRGAGADKPGRGQKDAAADEKLHPSWAAKQAQKKQQLSISISAAPAATKKIVFDD